MANSGYIGGYEKIVKTYHWLTTEYGFEREMQENITSAARYFKIQRQELENSIKNSLRIYAEEHAKLPVYNMMQWLARQAAIFVGLEKFDKAAQCLDTILKQAPTEDIFKEKALEFHRDEQGQLKRFTPSEHK